MVWKFIRFFVFYFLLSNLIYSCKRKTDINNCIQKIIEERVLNTTHILDSNFKSNIKFEIEDSIQIKNLKFFRVQLICRDCEKITFILDEKNEDIFEIRQIDWRNNYKSSNDLIALNYTINKYNLSKNDITNILNFHISNIPKTYVVKPDKIQKSKIFDEKCLKYKPESFDCEGYKNEVEIISALTDKTKIMWYFFSGNDKYLVYSLETTSTIKQINRYFINSNDYYLPIKTQISTSVPK